MREHAALLTPIGGATVVEDLILNHIMLNLRRFYSLKSIGTTSCNIAAALVGESAEQIKQESSASWSKQPLETWDSI